MLEKYLTIFRSMNNFVFVGEDGKTPAMLLGFTNQPLTYDDILWPGQRIPQRKRRRRRGQGHTGFTAGGITSPVTPVVSNRPGIPQCILRAAVR